MKTKQKKFTKIKANKKEKAVKITSYKKAYEKELLEKQEVEIKYTALSRAANQVAPNISALLLAEQIKDRALKDLALARDIIIKHDV